MTTRDDFSGGTVDRLLLDAGHTDVPELRAALLSIASLAQMPVPAPGAELAAMLAGPRDELTRKRWLRQHRPTVVGLAVLAGMGLGVTGVAATSQVSEDGSGLWSVQQLTTDWAPDWTLPLAPAATGQDGPAGWVSPLFLQLDHEGPSAVDGPAEPPAPPAAQEHANGQSAATPPDTRVLPPVKGSDWAPGAASGHGKAGQPDADSPRAGKSDASADEQSGQGSLQEGGMLSGQAAPAPEEGSEVRGESGRKKEKSSTGLLDSALDSSLDPISRWLGKLR